MKIEGWDKINGFAYKGYVITNTDYDAKANSYYADILNLNDSESMGWFMNLWPQENGVHLLKITDVATAPKPTATQTGLTSDKLRNLRMFRIHYEHLVEEMILLTTTHTSNKVSGTTGIINQVQTSGTNFVYAKSRRSGSSFTQSKLLQAIKDLEEQLKQYV